MKCIYCKHPYTYLLGNRQRKCSRCKRKFSLAKIEKQQLLYCCFEAEMTAKEASKKTGMHVGTVHKYYDRFRENWAFQCDKDYEAYSHEVTDYDEYLYLPRSLDPNVHIAKVKHFLTLAYHGKVYNLMMPSISRLGLDPSNENEHKLLEKYLHYHTISMLFTERSTIRRFWEYFEQFILKYHGISDERFIYYLKEAEWRFNRRA